MSVSVGEARGAVLAMVFPMRGSRMDRADIVGMAAELEGWILKQPHGEASPRDELDRDQEIRLNCLRLLTHSNYGSSKVAELTRLAEVVYDFVSDAPASSPAETPVKKKAPRKKTKGASG